MALAIQRSPELTAWLTGPDPVFGRAAEAEVGKDGADALSWLMERLGQDHWDSVPRVARLLGGFGDEAVEPLLAALDDPGRAAGSALAFRYLGPGHGHRLGELLAKSPRDDMRVHLVRAAGEYGDAANANDIVQAVLSTSADSAVAEHGLTALERIVCAQREPRDARVVIDECKALLARTGESAGFSLHPSWSIHVIRTGWLDPVIEALDKPDPGLPPWWFVRCAQWLGISRAGRAVGALGRVALNGDWPVDVRIAALGALADNGSDGALASVARASSVTEGLDEDAAGRYSAGVDAAVARLLGQGDEPTALAHEIIDRAHDEGHSVALADALRGLGRHGERTPEDIDALQQWLRDEDWLVRGAAAMGLAYAAGADAAEALRTAYQEASEPIERLEIAAALAFTASDRDRTELNDRLCASDMHSVWALVQPIREDAVAAFVAANDPDRADAWAEVMQIAAPAQQAQDESTAGASGPDEAEPPRGSPPAQADTEARDDQLGRTQLVSVLVAMLDDATQGTPFTFGLFGGWGEGKSSVLRQLEGRLDSDETQHRFAVAWFNAWQYEKTDNLAAGLVQESVRALRPRSRVRRLAVALRFAWRRHRSKVVWAILVLAASIAAALVGALSSALGKDFGDALAGAGVVSAITVITTVIVKLYRNPVAGQLLTYFRLPDYAAQLGLLPAMRDELEQLWTLRRDDGVQRLVVVVDDLDRCSSTAITATLDAVRLVMDLPDVIVILALDERICLRAVAHEYKELSTAERSEDEIARDFLAKIVQLPIRLERPPSMDDYIDRSLFPDGPGEDGDGPRRPGAPDPAASTTALGVSASTEVNADEAGAAYAGADLPSGTYAAPAAGALGTLLAREVMRETADERSAFRDLAGAAGITNPRQLRRLRNTYRFIKAMAPGLQWRKLMMMLFWQELLFALPREQFIARAAAPALPVADGDPMPRALADAVGKTFDGDTATDAYRDAVLAALLPRLDT